MLCRRVLQSSGCSLQSYWSRPGCSGEGRSVPARNASAVTAATHAYLLKDRTGRSRRILSGKDVNAVLLCLGSRHSGRASALASPASSRCCLKRIERCGRTVPRRRVMLADLADWRVSPSDWVTKGPEQKSRPPAMVPHDSRSAGSTFIITWQWSGKVQTESYRYAALPNPVIGLSGSDRAPD